MLEVATADSRVRKPVDRDEWLAVRRPYFNASATSILFDRHPYQTPGDYATVKLTGTEQHETRAMIRGRRLEAAIATWWGDETGYDVEEPPWLYTHGRLMATVDRIAHTRTGLWHPVEIKTTTERSREPQRYWLDQCQTIMLCTGTKFLDLVWFDPGMDLRDERVYADPALQDQIVERAERFMAAIDLGMLPDWITPSYSNVQSLHPHPVGAVEFDDAALDLVRNLEAVRAVKREAEKDERRLRDAIAALVLDNECAVWQGYEVLSWRPTAERHVVDLDMLAADHPDLVEKYRRPVAGHRMMLTKLGVAT